MPYIDAQARERISIDICFGHPEDFTVGNLTYVLTYIVNGYVKKRGKSFQSLAEVVAALEQTKDEFQRRVVHPYEDEKMKKNGDVYP